MKNVLALLLAALLLMFLPVAFAEEEQVREQSVTVFDDYRITCVVPDGYSLEVSQLNALTFLLDLTPDDPTRPDVNMTVSKSELPELEGFTMNDALTEEQKQFVYDMLIKEMVNPEVNTYETTFGTKLLAVHEETEADEYLILLTVWNGFVIETDMFPGIGSKELTDEQMDTVIQFISDFFIFENIE